MTVTSSLTAYDAAALLPQIKGLLSITFPEHDEQLSKLGVVAKGQLERYIGGTLDEVTVTVVYSSLLPDDRLPLLPFLELVSGPVGLEISNGGYLISRHVAAGSLVYKAGFTELPAELEHAIVMIAANLFDGGNRNWYKLAATHRVNSWAG